jgi:hypothetical protein
MAVPGECPLLSPGEANGYFLLHEQCVQEIIQSKKLCPSSHILDDDEPNDFQSTAAKPGLPCYWLKVMQLQSDFKNKRPWLQTIIKDAGRICLFLPNFTAS